MYIKRHIEKTIIRLGKAFPVVLATGARQVGKSTVLKNMFPDIAYYTLDNIGILEAMKRDSQEFLALNDVPIVLDEIQRAPESFISIKYMVDKDRTNGMYYITGSQRYNLLKNVTDSLAGRLFAVEVLGLSAREINGDLFDTPFKPDKEYLKARKLVKKIPLKELWQRIHRGSMPELYVNQNIEWQDFWGAYVTSYIERDVRQLEQVGDILYFAKFLTALAARTGELLNLQSIAKDVEINIKTAQKWLSVLEASGIIYILHPYHSNINKRIVKTPKIYFLDTGLVCYLCKWNTAESLVNGNAAGQIYETYVLSEILKSYYNAGKKPDIYFFRNSSMQEVDFILVEGNVIFPIEVKKKTVPTEKDISNFSALANAYPNMKIGDGCVICNSEAVLPLKENTRIVPIDYI